MKKKLSILLCIAVSFCFFSCNKNDDKGKLVIHAVSYKPYVDSVVKKFEEKTGIKTSYSLMSTSNIIENARKKDTSADIWFGGNVDVFNDAAKEGLLYAYEADNSKNLTNIKYKDENNYWYGVYIGFLGFCINTEILEQKNLLPPVDWDQLLEEKYKGLIAFGNPETSTTGKLIINTIVQLRGKEKAMEYFKQLDKNIYKYPKAGIEPLEMCINGEIAIGISFMHDILHTIIDNNSTKIMMTTPISGTSYELGATAILKNGKNIENAKKFIEFALSAECANLAQENGSYQFVVVKDSKPVQNAIAAGFDMIEPINYDREDVRKNGSSYYKAFYDTIKNDERVKYE